MDKESTLLQCYNKGCGKQFDPGHNNDDSCCHHPGGPIFHDAYKGWSCCNKKCTDFTEFLNIKGCTKSKHSNVKPPEPEKKPQNVDINEVIEIKPIVPVLKERPPFETPTIVKNPIIAPSLKNKTFTSSNSRTELKSGEVVIGTSCKNKGCTTTYQGPDSTTATCTYHPGVPIFHEGLKFWSCCQRRTTDFDVFLSQPGCNQGKHLWIEQNNDKKNVQCRWDHHQTGSYVVVSIYAKEYCIQTSTIELNPIRLKAHLVFPQQGNATFDLDIELQGIIDVDASEVNMYGTKVEIKLKKGEPVSWSKLEIRRILTPDKAEDKPIENAIIEQIDAVDLDDL